MKFVTALIVIIAGVAVSLEHYNIDVSILNIDGVIKNREKLKMYSDCLLDVGDCNHIGTAIKSHIPQALETGCAKCTPAQKQAIRKVILAGKEQLPEETEKLMKKYDPEGQYRDEIEKFLASTD